MSHCLMILITLAYLIQILFADCVLDQGKSVTEDTFVCAPVTPGFNQSASQLGSRYLHCVNSEFQVFECDKDMKFDVVKKECTTGPPQCLENDQALTSSSAVPDSATASSDISDSASSAVPDSASVAVPESASSKVQNSASSAVPDSASSKVSDSASSAVPDSASSKVPNSASSTVSDSASSAVADSVTTSSAVPDSASSTASHSASSTVPDSASSTVPASASSTVPASASSTVPASASSTVPASASSTLPASASSTVPDSASSTVPDSASTTIPDLTSAAVPVINSPARKQEDDKVDEVPTIISATSTPAEQATSSTPAKVSVIPKDDAVDEKEEKPPAAFPALPDLAAPTTPASASSTSPAPEEAQSSTTPTASPLSSTTTLPSSLLQSTPAVMLKKILSSQQASPSSVPTVCTAETCPPPNCYCLGSTPQLDVQETPQFVMLTFDDAVTNHFMKVFYRDLLVDNTFSLQNPNKCPIKATFFVSAENTDFNIVKELYAKGHEFASHTEHHILRDGGTKQEYTDEIVGVRDMFVTNSSIDGDKVVGFRAPYLKLAGNQMFEVLQENKFVYDTSISNVERKKGKSHLWPFGLDFPIPASVCPNGPCPDKGFPGLWEVPINCWMTEDGGHCAMIDACIVANTTDDEVTVREKYLKYFRYNFYEAFYPDKIPMHMFTHASMFLRNQGSYLALIDFLQEIIKLPDVWLVTPTQVIDWMKNPVSNDDVKNGATSSLDC